MRKLPAVEPLGARASSSRHLRRRRLVAYLHDALGGSRSRLIEQTGLTHGRVSQLFDERQPFGEQAAANLAEKLGLPLDYFEHDAPGTEPAEGASGAKSPWMLSELERDVLRALRALPLDQQVQAVAELVAKAEMRRYIHRHAPEPREPEPAVDVPQPAEHPASFARLDPAMALIENGQRVRVLLVRGGADEWLLGTVLDWYLMKVKLDEEPPGMPRIVVAPDIADWRPAD